MNAKYSDSPVSIKDASRAKPPRTKTSLGTKLKVISFMDVAACIIPIIRPTTKAIVKIGPAAITTFQKANLKCSIFESNSISISIQVGRSYRTNRHGPTIYDYKQQKFKW